MTACRICLDDVGGDDTYHPRCARSLFGAPHAPRIEIELAKLHTAGLAMVGHTSISGIQRKISVGLSTDRATLQVATEGGRYILKPAGETFPHLPENEHATMRLAALAGIEIPPCGLVSLADGSLAFLTRRFDRLDSGRKVRQEDFCQLVEKSPKEKYQGSAELCVRLLRRYASEPLIEILKLYRLLVFAWWTGNGDLHLKNLSIVSGEDGRHRLSPAYDLLCTRLVIPDDPLALPVGGKRDRLDRSTWLELADYAGLRRPAAERVLDTLASRLEPALGAVGRSLLPADMREAYARLLEARTALLGAGRDA